jgi:acid phosphatase (class A)
MSALLRSLALALGVTLLGVASPAPLTSVSSSVQTVAPLSYLKPGELDLTLLLPPPPPPNSAEEKQDEDAVASMIAQRSPSEVAEARDESKRTVFFFATAIGPQFQASDLPVTAAFFKRMNGDVEELVRFAKDYWERARPADAREKHGSYPSGHAAFAASTAIVLSMMLPEKRDAIFDRARIFSLNRIVLGVHYPSDIAAGWTAGTVIAAAMMRDAKFQGDYAASKREVRALLRLAP